MITFQYRAHESRYIFPNEQEEAEEEIKNEIEGK
jgi:hypothetical protein